MSPTPWRRFVINPERNIRFTSKFDLNQKIGWLKSSLADLANTENPGITVKEARDTIIARLDSGNPNYQADYGMIKKVEDTLNLPYFYDWKVKKYLPKQYFSQKRPADHHS